MFFKDADKAELSRGTSLDAELFIIAETDGNGTVTGFPKGGGSSSKPYIRAFESPDSASRSLRQMRARNVVSENGRVVKVTRVMEVL